MKLYRSEHKKRIVLLDTHAILHRAYHALPDFASSSGEPTGALYGLCTMIAKIAQDLSPDYIIACYDRAEPTYRHEAYKDYKAGRSKTDESLVSQIIRSHEVIESLSIPIYDAVGFEADDILGTIVEQTKHKKDIEIVIASGDMDTLQLVEGNRVRVYTLKKGINDTILYDELAVDERFGFGPKTIPDYKGLRGDPSDNIIGIAGIGEKTATTLLVHFKSIAGIYKALKNSKEEFAKIGITPRIVGLLEAGKEEAEFSAALATIRRDAPIVFTLPEKPWREAFDMTKAEALFKALEFRTLKDRFMTAINGKTVSQKIADDKTSDTDTETVNKNKVAINVDPLELKKASIALWLINSSMSNATLDDILRETEKDNLKDATDNLMKGLAARGLEKVYNEIELPLIPIIEMMQTTGVKIDRAYLSRLGVEYKEKLVELEKEIWQLAGIEFNVASPKQLGDILFEKLALKPPRQKKTSTGAKSTKESELEKMKDMHPIIGLILEHRELSKLVSTYIDVILENIDANDRLHTTLLQTGTTTGRMASQNPNIQNVPIKSELGRNIRRAFIAEKGYTLVSCDYSQIELRIAAFLSGDEKMIDIFRKGEDIHTSVAAQVFNVPLSAVDKEMRRKAKVINFGIMYGMGVSALKENLGTDRAEAQEFYNAYFATFSTFAAYLERIKKETAEKGYTETFFGRRRYFEGINSRLPFVRAMAERMAINAPIQGTEADIIKIAMIHIANYIADKGLSDKVRMLLQVHDELLFEIESNVVEKVVPEILRLMETVVNPARISGVVCKSEAKIGLNWNDMKEIATIDRAAV